LKKYIHIQANSDEKDLQVYVYLVSEKFFFEYFFPNKFYEVLLSDNLYYLILSRNKLKLFIFDKSLQYVSFIDLTAIKKIYAEGKYSFVLHFYDDLFPTPKLKLSFFSILEKESFLKDIFTDKKDDKELLLKKIVLLNFLSREGKMEMALLNDLIMFLKRILKRKSKYYSKLFYNKDVYDCFNYNTNDFNINSSNVKNRKKRRISQFELNFLAKKFSKKLFFMFNSYKVYEYFFSRIFYAINIVKYKYKIYKAIYDDCILREFEEVVYENMINKTSNNNISYDSNENDLSKEFFNKNDFKKKLRKAVSIDFTNADNKFINHFYELESKNRSDNSNKFEKDLIKEYKLSNQNEESYSHEDILDRKNSEDDLNANVKRARHNVEHKKLKNYLDDFSSSKNSLEDQITIKSNFEKVSFEVNICYYFSKETKLIDVYKDGIFTIYKKGKVNFFFFKIYRWMKF
jgi:hypothetical protein